MNRDEEDKVVWKGDNKGKFSIRHVILFWRQIVLSLSH